MQIKATRSNQTEITFDNGYTVLFSYRTPVLAHRDGETPIVTAHRYSVTTTRHINQWLERNDFDRDRCRTMQQDILNGLAS